MLSRFSRESRCYLTPRARRKTSSNWRKTLKKCFSLLFFHGSALQRKSMRTNISFLLENRCRNAFVYVLRHFQLLFVCSMSPRNESKSWFTEETSWLPSVRARHVTSRAFKSPGQRPKYSAGECEKRHKSKVERKVSCREAFLVTIFLSFQSSGEAFWAFFIFKTKNGFKSQKNQEFRPRLSQTMAAKQIKSDWKLRNLPDPPRTVNFTRLITDQRLKLPHLVSRLP